MEKEPFYEGKWMEKIEIKRNIDEEKTIFNFQVVFGIIIRFNKNLKKNNFEK